MLWMGDRMQITVQCIIAIILLWFHSRPITDTIHVRTPEYTGVLPISQRPLPLTADDVARGLIANPTVTVPPNLLTKAHQLRTDYAIKRAERTELVDRLGTQCLEILVALEEQ